MPAGTSFEDFTKNGRRYEAILDAVGNLTFKRCRGSLKWGGVRDYEKSRSPRHRWGSGALRLQSVTGLPCSRLATW